LTFVLLLIVAIPIIGGWLVTSDSPRQRAVGKALDIFGKGALVVFLVVSAVVWLMRI